MLAQLPPHTVAKKVDNYEHLDLLWGKDVDKVVFPHVLEFLKTYAEPVSGSKALEAQSMENKTSNPPAYSKDNDDTVLRKRKVDSAKRQSNVSYAAVASDAAQAEQKHHSKRVAGRSYAQVATEENGHESDSDQTMGEEHDRVVPGISFADAAKAHLQDNSGVTPKTIAEDEGTEKEDSGPAPGIDVPVTSEISYADMAAK